jgi:hypothetical protein
MANMDVEEALMEFEAQTRKSSKLGLNQRILMGTTVIII